MKNLLIIENNLTSIQKIINSIPNNIFNIKLSTNYQNSLEVLKKERIHMILLNYDINGDKILDYISKNELYIYKKSIIVIRNQNKENIIYDKYIFKALEDNLESIIEYLNKLTLIKNNVSNKGLKSKIFDELQKLHYNPSHIGTKYLLETIFEIYSKNYISFNLKGDIFHIISKKFDKSVNTIKCNITQATNSMLKRCSKSDIKDYCNFIDYYKPTVKQIIETILDNL